MRAVVAGAGVGGLTAAIALRRRGIDVRVLEAAPAARTSGGGLGLASNATKVLRALGIDLPALGVGRVCREFDLRTAAGRPIRALPIRSIADELGSPVVNVRRRDLLGVLRAAPDCPPVEHGFEVVRFGTGAAGVSVTAADGQVVTGDVLIGADGIRSVVRARLTGPEPVHTYGYVCWIATVPFAHPRLPTGAAAHYWGNGRRFGLIDVGGGHVYWWGTSNRAPGGTLRAAGRKSEILRTFDGWAPEVRDVVARTPQADIVTVPAQDRSFLDAWGSGPVTLVGDAAHPMLTSLSQGAGSAVEDGYTLAHHLGAAADPVTGLRRYEQARHDRTRWLVAASRRLSRMEQLSHPVATGLRNLLLRHAPMSVVRNQNLAPMRFDLPA